MSKGFLDAKTITPAAYRAKLLYEARWNGRQNRVQRAISDILLKSKPEFYLTLHFNHPVKEVFALERLKEFFGRVDRKIVGREFYKSRKRTKGFIVFENLTSNFHAHCGIRFPKGTDSILELEAFMISEWKKLVPRGSMDLRRITRSPHVLTGYTAKQIFYGERTDRIHWLEEFWPAKL